MDRTAPPTGTSKPEGEGRSARKHRAILDAATSLFLRNGYAGTSTDQIAARAEVSKQTVYKHFADKEQLFREMILGVTEPASDELQAMTRALQDTGDLGKDLVEFAHRYLELVLQPAVLQLRRLFIAEASRFPELARAYYDQGPERAVATLASCVRRLAQRGLLQVDDPLLAARHLAFLILSIPLDRAMFYGDDAALSAAELRHLADEGVRVFLAAYGPR